MLEFYYDCLNLYLKNLFELTQTDTDSIYMTINQRYPKNIRIDIRLKFFTLVRTKSLLLGFLGDVVIIM